MSSIWMIGILAGALLATGCYLVVSALVPMQIRLSDAIGRLDGRVSATLDASGGQLSGSLESVGAWGYQRLRLPLPESTRRLLAMQDRSIADFFGEKVVWMVGGLAVPTVFSLASWVFGEPFRLSSLGFAIIGAAVGYFVPDFRLHRSANITQAGATEAVFTFFDLVILERLANRSVTQALHSAAGISDATVFRRVRMTLDRARLEQVPPWRELRRLSSDLDLKVVADMADVLKLEEQGAALAEPLRARVRELRDAHLTKSKQDAQALTERMTIWMTLPALIFGLIFLVPPLLRLFGGSL